MKYLKIECKCLDYEHLDVLKTITSNTSYRGYTDPAESYFKLRINTLSGTSNINIKHESLLFISGNSEYTVFNTFIAQDKKSKAFQNVYEYNKYLTQKVNHLNAMLDAGELPMNEYIRIEGFNGDNFYQLSFSIEDDKSIEDKTPLNVSISYVDVNSENIEKYMNKYKELPFSRDFHNITEIRKCVCHVRKDGIYVPTELSIIIKSDEGIFTLYTDNSLNMDNITEKTEAIRSIIQKAVYENRVISYRIDYTMNPNVSRIIRITPLEE